MISLSARNAWCVGLMALVFCTLGLPYKKMNFFWDSYGNVLFASQAGKNSHYLKEFFYENVDFEQNHEADNAVTAYNATPRTSIFSFIYRPLAYVYFRLQYDLFGKTPYLFFLFLVFVHALNTGILFLIFAEWMSLVSAFLAAALFAFNHMWWSLLRWFDIQPYFVEAFFLLLALCCTLQALRTNQYFWSLLTALCLLHNFFLKEQSIGMFPLFVVMFLVHHLVILNKPYTDTSWAKRCLSFSIPSLVAFGLLVAARWLVWLRLPQRASTTGNMLSSLSSVAHNGLEWVKQLPNVIVDQVGLNWFPPFHKEYKLLLLLVFLAFFAWLFKRVQPRVVIPLFIFGYLIFAWPTFTLRHYHPRYVYIATMFIVGLIAYALREFELKETLRRLRIAQAGLLFIVLLNAFFLCKRTSRSEQETDLVARSFTTLVEENPGIFGRTMCFYGLPPELFDACVAQAMTWLAPDYKRRAIYYFKYEKLPTECKLDQSFLDTNPLFITWDEKHQKMSTESPQA